MPEAGVWRMAEPIQIQISSFELIQKLFASTKSSSKKTDTAEENIAVCKENTVQ